MDNGETVPLIFSKTITSKTCFKDIVDISVIMKFKITCICSSLFRVLSFYTHGKCLECESNECCFPQFTPRPVVYLFPLGIYNDLRSEHRNKVVTHLRMLNSWHGSAFHQSPEFQYFVVVNPNKLLWRHDWCSHTICICRKTNSQILNVSRLVFQLSLLNPLKPGVENEDVLGAEPTVDAPTTSEWSTFFSSAKVRLVTDTSFWQRNGSSVQSTRIRATNKFLCN